MGKRRPSKFLLAGEVAARLGLTRQRIHQLDHLLMPERIGGGLRLYTEESVVALERLRATAAHPFDD